MRSGARTPEELETLFEDAFVVRDRSGLAELFDDGAILVSPHEPLEARGADQIGRLASVMWSRNQLYVAAPRRVLQARELTLIVADGAINVARRGSDRTWRYAIALLSDTRLEDLADGPAPARREGNHTARAANPRTGARR
jgi:hypothetical protein